ncbi:MAG: Ig-like domain-containing protein [Pseudomonadota bacterium]
MMYFRNALLFVFALALAACGGGGGTVNGPISSPSKLNVELIAYQTNLPVQNEGSFVQPPSALYTTTVVAKVTRPDGSPLPNGTKIQFMMNGGNTYSGALYPQPFEMEETEDANGNKIKYPKAYWSYAVESAAGQALMLFHAWTRPGKVRITVSATDPQNSSVGTKDIEITVGSGVSTGMPSTITAELTNGPIYVANQGKNDVGLVNVFVADPAGEPVGAGDAANVKAEILNPEIGATLQGGGTMAVNRTINGQTQFNVRSGSQSGVVKLRLTADAADNNVENGIQQPVTDDVQVVIVDGRVAAITLTGPYVNAIRNNQANIPLSSDDLFDNGSYSRLISAVVKDRDGNPVPGITVRFGLIDSPIYNYPMGDGSRGVFALSGVMGNPVEGGNRFDQQDGVPLQTGMSLADGSIAAARRHDHILLLPSEEGVDRDLASNRSIQQVLSNSTLLTSAPFPSSTGGDNGYVIPWVVGRAQYGNIIATAITDSTGVASTLMTYPVSRINQIALLSAEAVDTGVTTVEGAYYAGIAQATLSSSVTEVAANTTTPVTMCVADAKSVPMKNTSIGYSGGAGKVVVNYTGNFADGDQPIVTGESGCSSFYIIAQGQMPGSDDLKLSFFAAGAVPVEVTVKAPGEGQILAQVQSASCSGGSATASPKQPCSGSAEIVVTVYDDNGNVMVGVPVSASMEGATSITVEPAVTDANGQVTITVEYQTTEKKADLKIEILGGETKTVSLPGLPQ